MKAKMTRDAKNQLNDNQDKKLKDSLWPQLTSDNLSASLPVSMRAS